MTTLSRLEAAKSWAYEDLELSRMVCKPHQQFAADPDWCGQPDCTVLQIVTGVVSQAAQWTSATQSVYITIPMDCEPLNCDNAYSAVQTNPGRSQLSLQWAM